MDDSRNTLDSMDAWARHRFYDGLGYPYYLRGRDCPAGGQSQSGGDDQPEIETCIARPKTRRQREARTVGRPADTAKDHALGVLRRPGKIL